MIDIRPATSGDIAAITRIYADAVKNGTASFELSPPSEHEVARRQTELLANNYPYLAAELDGALSGYAYLSPFHRRLAYRWSIEDSIYVAAPAQRRGVGRALLDRLITQAEGLGFRQMVAVIGDPAVQTASVGLHTAVGFRLAGTLASIGFKHGRWLDAMLMQRPLGAGATTPPPVE
ncbi:MAG: N-acetyltransferase family protein [Xanthobacteraceae bacterium]